MNLSKIIASLAILLSLFGGSSAAGRMALRNVKGGADLESTANHKSTKATRRRHLEGQVRTLHAS